VKKLRAAQPAIERFPGTFPNITRQPASNASIVPARERCVFVEIDTGPAPDGWPGWSGG